MRRALFVCALSIAALSACRHTPVVVGAGERVHVVARGETAGRIARQYGVPLGALVRRNELVDPDQLKIGQRLVIPPPAVADPIEDPVDDDQPDPPVIPLPNVAVPAPVDAPLAWATTIGSAPFIWPVDGVAISLFGPREGARHQGLDIAAPEGTVVWASAAGEVLFAGTRAGYGALIIVQHADDLVTIYAHNQRNLVTAGRRVKQGEPIARVGRSGGATAPALHFEVRLSNKPVDPLARLP